MSRVGRLLGLALLAALVLAARGPLHGATWSLPVSNDDAIPLLIARHVLKGELTTILWNQPYNGTLDAYLLAPGVALFGEHAAFRLYEALCGLLLVIAAAALAGLVGGEKAAWASGFLAAVGTPYLALMAATGPTPNFLVPLLTAFAAAAGLQRLDHRWRSPAVAPLTGMACGLAVWDSALALPPLLGIGAGLWMAGLRPRPWAAALFALGAVLGASPLGIARLAGASASSPVTALRPRWLWSDGLADLARAAGGLFGVQVPLVVDGPERAALPAPLAVALAAALSALVLLGARRGRAAPMVGWAVLLAGAFAASRRTGGDEIRYLFGLALPVLVLAGVGLAVIVHRPTAMDGVRSRSTRMMSTLLPTLPVLAVTLPWLVGHRLVLSRWRDPQHAARVWQVPPMEPVLSTLSRAGVASVYASLQFAGRITLESGGEVIASQAWNERIPGDPLRFRDEVDLDPKAAWVLSNHLSRGMPRTAGFRELMGALGGSWKEDLPGEFAVFRRFVPPYDETHPVPPAAMTLRTPEGMDMAPSALDRDGSTWWVAPRGISRGSGISLRVEPRRRLSALVLVVDLEQSPLAVPWVADLDGAPVASGPGRHGLQWVNGAPRAGKQALLVVPLAEREGSEVRLLFQGEGPVLRVAEVYAYGPDELTRPAAGAGPAERALSRARAGDWNGATALYAEAARLEPERAAYLACLHRSQWRSRQRVRLDVESLDDGGPALVLFRPTPLPPS